MDEIELVVGEILYGYDGGRKSQASRHSRSKRSEKYAAERTGETSDSWQNRTSIGSMESFEERKSRCGCCPRSVRSPLMLVSMILVAALLIFVISGRLSKSRADIDGEAPAPVDKVLSPETMKFCPRDVNYLWDGRCGDEVFSRCVKGSYLVYQTHRLEQEFFPEISNGHLATVPLTGSIFVSDFYNGDLKSPGGPRRARIPMFNVRIANAIFSREASLALDAEDEVFFRNARLATEDKVVTIQERWYAPVQNHSLLVHEIQVTNREQDTSKVPQAIAFEGHIALPSDDIDVEKSEPNLPLDIYTMVGSNKVSESGKPITFAMVANLPRQTKVVEVAENHTYHFLTVVVTSLQSENPEQAAMAIMQEYAADNKQKASQLFNEHKSQLRARSGSKGVEVHGDITLAREVSASMYLLRSNVNPDHATGISSGGFGSKRNAAGHVRWDQELFSLPPLVMLDPLAAKSVLQYRYDRIEAARNMAADCGKDSIHNCPESYQSSVTSKALRFPLESSHAGVEVAPESSPRADADHTGGAIALMVRQYWYATGDKDWLSSVGWALVSGIASYYAARVKPREGDANSYTYENTVGPEELSGVVSNSAYVNAVAKIALEFAVEAAQVLGYAADLYKDFAEKAKGLQLPTAEKGYHSPAYVGFPKSNDEHVQQADAVWLGYPLNMVNDRQRFKDDLLKYLSITEKNAPSTTWSMFAINLWAANETNRGRESFDRARANIRQPFDLWAEHADGKGISNSVASAGAFLQTFIFGIGGAVLQHDGLYFKPRPPSVAGSSAEAVVIHLRYRGWHLRQEIREDHATYVAVGREVPSLQVEPLCIQVSGNATVLELSAGILVIAPDQAAIVRSEAHWSRPCVKTCEISQEPTR